MHLMSLSGVMMLDIVS